jgi:hypothetical protein
MVKAISLVLASFLLPQSVGLQTNNAKKGQVKQSPSLKLNRAGKTWTHNNLPIAPLAISSDRLLVTVGNTLYMLDSNKQVVWQYSKSTDLAAQPILTADGTICVIAIDGISYGLDVNTGQERWDAPFMNGSAQYKQIKAYKGDQYLVVVDMSGYRAKLSNPNAEDAIEDVLEMCQGARVLWEKKFPRDSDLAIWGDRILAITRKQGSVEIREIPARD